MKTKLFSSLIAMLILVLSSLTSSAQDNKTYDLITLKNPPTYPGGVAKFYEYLGSSIQYPKEAATNKVQGTVFVSFIVEKDGSITEVQTNGRTVGAGLDEEAVRVLKGSKKWNPGLLDGTPVRVKYNIPIKFSLPRN